MKSSAWKKKFKLSGLILVLFVALFIAIAVPSFARYKNRSSIADAAVWDGSVASSYRKGTGTSSDPYVISNGAEFAYFQSQLENTDYANTYFVLNGDIVLNDGVFSYNKDTGISYTKDGNTSVVSPYQESYSNIHPFPSIKQFKGFLDGNGYTIYGLFLTKNTNEAFGLFLNLEGTISNLYFSNTMIYGGSHTGGIASKARNASISNVMFQGNVVGNTERVENQFSLALDDIEKKMDVTRDEMIVPITRQKTDGKILRIKVSGKAEGITEDSTITLKNQVLPNGDFELELGTTIEDLKFVFQSNSNATFKLSNLKYSIFYCYGNSAGLISDSENVTITNVSQRANVYGSVYASGFINDANGTITIQNSYNTGTIYGNVGSGLVNRVEYNNSPVSISTSYNSGAIYATNSYGFVSSIDQSTITIQNSFNQNDNFVLGSIANSNVSVTNVACSTNNYVSSGEITGSIIHSDDLVTYARMVGFMEFVDSTDLASNPSHLWVYEGDSLPILALDDTKESIATINVSKYSWNNVGYELNSLKFTSLAFTINEVDHLKPIKEVSYYIHKSKTPLKKDEILNLNEWVSYSDVVSISDEGFYIVYAKVTDYQDKVTYLNTDLLILDLSGSSITMSLNDSTWKEVHSSVSSKYLTEDSNLSITAVDNLSGVKKIQYYVSDAVLTEEQFNTVSWLDYVNPIPVNSKTGVIVYSKVVDNTDYVTYANTDRLLVNGFSQTKMIAGRTTSYSDHVMITNRSSVSLYYSFEDSATYSTDGAHVLILNQSLPENTMITIMDLKRSKTYKYTTNIRDEERIPFTKFLEVGSTNGFKESIYTGSIQEDYKIILDFYKTNMETDLLDLQVSLAYSRGEETIIGTVGSNNKFQVLRNKDANSSFSSNYSDVIYYNADASYSIPITGSLNFGTHQGGNVIDTTLEEKRFGLALKMIESDGKVVSKNNIQNIKFKIDSKYYFMDNDGIVRMDLGVGLGNVSKNLVIEASSANISLPNGDYTFQLGYYVAYDGIYSSEITYFKDIPVHVADSSYQKMQSFQIKMKDEDRILEKLDSKSFIVGVLQNSSSTDAVVRVRLLRKSSFDAVSQSFEEIDLGEYSNASITNYEGFIYQTTIIGNDSHYRNVSFDLNTKTMGSGVYALSFDLYHGDTYIKSIQKKFIIK